MSAKENDMNARLGFLRDFAIGALLIGGAILILALPSVQNFLAAASAAGDEALATAGAIGLTTPAVAAALYGLRKRRFGFAAGLLVVPLALALYAAQAEHAGATMPRWNRGRCSSPARTRKTSCSMTPIG